MMTEVRKKLMNMEMPKPQDKFKEHVTLTCWSFISLSMTLMIKSLESLKFVSPILSELSTMNARSTGAHLHSEDAHINKFTKDDQQSSHRE